MDIVIPVIGYMDILDNWYQLPIKTSDYTGSDLVSTISVKRGKGGEKGGLYQY